MISISNSILAKNVMFQLDKIENEFFASELNTIEELVISTTEYGLVQELLNFEEFLYFNNLKRITFLDMHISNRDLYILKALAYLEELTFNHCDFELPETLKEFKLKHLGLINCVDLDIEFVYEMKSLKSLALNNVQNINASRISNLGKLESLDIAYSTVGGILMVPNIKYLIIDNTPISDISFCSSLENLETLSLDPNQISSNQEVVEQLKAKGVKILHESVGYEQDEGVQDESV